VRPRTLSLLLLATAAAYFVDLFLPWIGRGGRNIAGWDVPLTSPAGTLALSVALVELVRVVGVWTSRGSLLVGFFLAAGVAGMGLASLINLRWGGFLSTGFGTWCYGSWLAVALLVGLLGLAILRLRELTES
jgi:hypothetical protein